MRLDGMPFGVIASLAVGAAVVVHQAGAPGPSYAPSLPPHIAAAALPHAAAVLAAPSLRAASAEASPAAPTAPPPAASDTPPLAAVPPPSAPAAPPAAPPHAPLTFAVISDMHVPDSGKPSPALLRGIAAVLAAHPRFVIVCGDETNGNPGDPRGRVLLAPRWWREVRGLLAPLRVAGIPVLPVAGNHDSYLAGYRSAYAAAFADLADWAAPLEIIGHGQPADLPEGAVAIDAAPFSYAVEVDGVHVALTHHPEQLLADRVAAWLDRDLGATQAPMRIVVGHVPLRSVMAGPDPAELAQIGGIMERHGASLYIGGHEHLVWDEDVAVPGGHTVRQVLVGTLSGTYNFGPTVSAQRRARCHRTRRGTHCVMPHGGTDFALQLNSLHHPIERQRQTFTLFTIDGDQITARPMAVAADGSARPFGDTPPPP